MGASASPNAVYIYIYNVYTYIYIYRLCFQIIYVSIHMFVYSLQLHINASDVFLCFLQNSSFDTIQL